MATWGYFLRNFAPMTLYFKKQSISFRPWKVFPPDGIEITFENNPSEKPFANTHTHSRTHTFLFYIYRLATLSSLRSLQVPRSLRTASRDLGS